MYRDPLAGDAENVMTPARRAGIMTRLAAEARMRQYRREAAAVKATGTLPIDHPAHHVACSAPYAEYGGILFADGAVHLFDREDFMHVEYARYARDTDQIESGASSGPDGWGFYYYPDSDYFEPYMLPARVQDSVAAITRALVAS